MHHVIVNILVALVYLKNVNSPGVVFELGREYRILVMFYTDSFSEMKSFFGRRRKWRVRRSVIVDGNNVLSRRNIPVRYLIEQIRRSFNRDITVK